ncbi:hypothetical protein SKAU_G00382180 [Synaphobranchus kaupii]|uniref:Uncharacterized protein n=1 Tax=Synaphobranchus kaupii TaxID=118154 RepID=A0A9Q1EDX2_SYNKA|nr:hypothetical protein SKAU_G00382180 [Synaphobranchus kaupii]
MSVQGVRDFGAVFESDKLVVTMPEVTAQRTRAQISCSDRKSRRRSRSYSADLESCVGVGSARERAQQLGYTEREMTEERALINQAGGLASIPGSHHPSLHPGTAAAGLSLHQTPSCPPPNHHHQSPPPPPLF